MFRQLAALLASPAFGASARLLAVTDRQLHESGNRDEVARNLGSLRASGIQIQGYAYRVLGINTPPVELSDRREHEPDEGCADPRPLGW